MRAPLLVLFLTLMPICEVLAQPVADEPAIEKMQPASRPATRPFAPAPVAPAAKSAATPAPAALRPMCDMADVLARRSAQSKRTVGILLASIGGGGGVVSGLLSWAGYSMCNPEDGCNEEKGVMIASFSAAAVSLAIGIPLAVIGSREVARVKERTASLPAIDVAVSGRGARLGATWSF